ncbi:uncharacterized protein LOC106655074 [Trichogramma pretiosum]|uniref:uncharacterized protein LOC106655074 n=1 Tax=Trichogramma pretiosum TaxID=7493 RepID=UPI0006C9DEE8|nr:uncharacterized protein LOC106655074 [Trichogramma pretiosum]
MSVKISTPKQKADLYLASSLCDGIEDNDFQQVVTLLQDKDADPNVLMPLHGITPFHLVIGNDSQTFAEEVTKLFLQHGGNPNVKSIDGMTPVHVAAAWGRTNILKLLLANGGDPLCLDFECYSPFHYAFKGHHFETVGILSEYCMAMENENGKNDIIPKYKLEFDKLLVNLGDMLAEYSASSNPSIHNSDENSYLSDDCSELFQINSEYSDDCQSGSLLYCDKNLVNSRNRKETLDTYCDNLKNNNYQDSAFNSETEESKKMINMVNDIISQLSNSCTSDIDLNNISFNEETEGINILKDIKSKQKIGISRKERNTKSVHNSQISNKKRRQSTLQIIKHRNELKKRKSKKFINKSNKLSDESFFEHNVSQSFTKNSPSSQHTSIHKNSSIENDWLHEPILSQSPNLHISSKLIDKNNESIESLEAKSTSNKPKTSLISQVVEQKFLEPSSSSDLNFKKILKPKKYFITPRKSTVTKTSENFLKKQLNNDYKTKVNEHLKYLSPFNSSNSKSKTLITSSNGNLQKSIKLKKNPKNISNHRNNVLPNLEQNNSADYTQKTNYSSDLFDSHVDSYDKKSNKTTSLKISGVELLDTKVISKSDIKSDSSTEQSINFPSEICIENHQNQIKEEKISLDNINQTFEKTINLSSSLIVAQGSLLSNADNDRNNDALQEINFHDLSDDTRPDNYSIKIDHNDVNSLISSNDNLIYIRDESLSSYRKIDLDSFLSMEEDYKYEDLDEGIVFLEKRFCVAPSCASSETSSYYTCSTFKSESLPNEMYVMDKITLRERLENMGQNPGPITTTTHRVYLKRLHKLESQALKSVHRNEILAPKTQNPLDFNKEKNLLKSSLLAIDWIKNIDDFETIERKVFFEFDVPNPSRKWREGTSKSSFNYLLLDPRLTQDLPRRAADMKTTEKWEAFLSAIFYVGKGKKSRPYAHLYDAFKIWVSKDQKAVNNKKIQRILDIWNEGKGVVVLHVFHNTIPVEAYTREAMMIDVLGTRKLGNCKSGDYYGIAATWNHKEKCEFGRFLLFKALQIFLIEGERQIFPDNL